MNRRSAAWLALAFLALVTTSASAADVVGPDGSLIRRTKLETACSAALERFCPDLSETPGQTRNQLICLKPYRSSLARGCRSAVSAGLK